MSKRIISTIFIAFTIIIAGCVTQHPLLYKGDDGGYVVASVGEYPGTDYHLLGLFMRKKGDTNPHASLPLAYGRLLLSEQPIDDTQLNVFKLAPGEYEIYRIMISEKGMHPLEEFRPTTDFPTPLRQERVDTAVGKATHYWIENISIPIVIKPKVATYIGSYRAISLGSRELLLGGHQSAKGGYFVVKNEEQRDIPRAKKIQPEITEIVNATPSAQSIGTPYIRSEPLTPQ